MPAICAASRATNAMFCRDSIIAVGPSSRASAAVHVDGRLHGVAGPPDVHAGNEPQRGRVLDRLVRRAVLAEADRIVREHEDVAQLHQRRHAQRVARIIGEREERPRVRNEPAVQRDAAGDRRHAELAHAELDVVAGRVGAHGMAAGPVGEHAAGQVGRAAEHLRQVRRERLDRLLRRLARGHRLAFGRLRLHQRARDVRKIRRQAGRPCAA